MQDFFTFIVTVVPGTCVMHTFVLNIIYTSQHNAARALLMCSVWGVHMFLTIRNKEIITHDIQKYEGHFKVTI